MDDKKMLVEAKDYFNNESDEFKREMIVEDLLVDIACEFIKYRVKNELTQKDLAKKLEITQAMVSKLESGDYNPSIKMLFEIAQKLSWNFKIEFNEVVEKYNYSFADEKVMNQNIEYFTNMGLAS